MVPGRGLNSSPKDTRPSLEPLLFASVESCHNDTHLPLRELLFDTMDADTNRPLADPQYVGHLGSTEIVQVEPKLLASSATNDLTKARNRCDPFRIIQLVNDARQ